MLAAFRVAVTCRLTVSFVELVMPPVTRRSSSSSSSLHGTCRCVDTCRQRAHPVHHFVRVVDHQFAVTAAVAVCQRECTEDCCPPSPLPACVPPPFCTTSGTLRAAV